MPFDNHDMKPMELWYFVLYVLTLMTCSLNNIVWLMFWLEMHLSTLTTWNQYIMCVNYHIISLIFRHSRHSFACNFLNNGPIFNPIDRWNHLSLPLFLSVYDSYVHVVTVEIYDTEDTSINGKQGVSVDMRLRRFQQFNQIVTWTIIKEVTGKRMSWVLKDQRQNTIVYTQNVLVSCRECRKMQESYHCTWK